MEVFRIAQEKYGSDLSGYGAWQNGGRWNEPGQYALYTSFSRSLALLELLVHVPFAVMKSKPYVLMTLLVPDEVKNIELKSSEINVEEAKSCLKIGSAFLKDGTNMGLIVPSVIMPEEQNVIFNPENPAYQSIKIISVRKLNLDLRFY